MQYPPWYGTANGRGDRGLFAAGNQISKGHRGNTRVSELRRAMAACVTADKIREVEAALYAKAIAGDVAAIRIWLEHCVGKPAQAVEVSGRDGGDIGIDMVGNAILAAIGDDQEARIKIADVFRQLAEMEESIGPIGVFDGFST